MMKRFMLALMGAALLVPLPLRSRIRGPGPINQWAATL